MALKKQGASRRKDTGQAGEEMVRPGRRQWPNIAGGRRTHDRPYHLPHDWSQRAPLRCQDSVSLSIPHKSHGGKHVRVVQPWKDLISQLLRHVDVPRKVVSTFFLREASKDPHGFERKVAEVGGFHHARTPPAMPRDLLLWRSALFGQLRSPLSRRVSGGFAMDIAS